MPQTSHGVYRCPSCDELTEADVGRDGTMTCPKCGHVSERKVPPTRKRVSMGLEIGGGSLVQRNINVRRHEAVQEYPGPTQLPEAKAPAPGSGEEVSAAGHRQEVISDDGERKLVRRHKKRRKTRPYRWVFLVLWVLSIVLVVLVVRKQLREIRKEARVAAARESASTEEKKEAEARAYLESEVPACRRLFAEFLEAADPAMRAQFVLGGSELSPKMATHYRQNTPFRPTEALVPGGSNLVLWDGGKPLIETAWTTRDGERVEAVFGREAGQWKLDWEAFVRFSTHPWHLFLSEVAGSEGTFRVWAKVQQSNYESQGDAVYSLRFYPPIDDALKRNRGKSPAVLIPVDSESGRRIGMILEENEKDREVGDRRLFLDDPMNMHRMRVVLEWREGSNDEHYLHLKEVLAGHWLGDRFEQSFEPPAPPEPEDPTPDGPLSGDQDA